MLIYGESDNHDVHSNNLLADRELNTLSSESQANCFVSTQSGKMSSTITSSYIMAFALAKILSFVDVVNDGGLGSTVTTFCGWCD